MFQRHYEQLGRESVDNEFNFEWKEVVEGKVSMCSNLSKECEDKGLDKGIETGDIVKCLQKLKK